MAKRAFAIASHPDDIEFMMAGTLIRLKELGYEIHYMNIADGALGGNMLNHRDLAARRREEAMASAKLIGAIFHESITHDLEVFYNTEQLTKVVRVVREVDPEIVLTHGPFDYMEDHINAGRLAVSGEKAFDVKIENKAKKRSKKLRISVLFLDENLSVQEVRYRLSSASCNNL